MFKPEQLLLGISPYRTRHSVCTSLSSSYSVVKLWSIVWVNDTSSFGVNIHSQGYDGLLGLGPNQSSVIRKKANNGWADTLLQRIFETNTSSSNYITLLLNRKNDPGQNITGQITVSEIVPGFENVTSMPKLDVETVNKLLKSGTHGLYYQG